MKNVVSLEDFCEKNFTKEQIRKIDIRTQQRIALRQLRELREKYNISQEGLSIKSGIPRSTISKIETGKRNVSVAKLVQIANALDRDLEIRFVERKNRKI